MPRRKAKIPGLFIIKISGLVVSPEVNFWSASFKNGFHSISRNGCGNMNKNQRQKNKAKFTGLPPKEATRPNNQTE